MNGSTSLCAVTNFFTDYLYFLFSIHIRIINKTFYIPDKLALWNYIYCPIDNFSLCIDIKWKMKTDSKINPVSIITTSLSA